MVEHGHAPSLVRRQADTDVADIDQPLQVIQCEIYSENRDGCGIWLKYDDLCGVQVFADIYNMVTDVCAYIDKTSPRGKNCAIMASSSTS